MSNGKRFEYNTDISANYSKEFGRNVIFANAQWSASERKYNTVTFGARGFANDKMDYITHAKEYLEGAPSGSESLAREMSVLLSMNYSLTTVICWMRLIGLMHLPCSVVTNVGDISGLLVSVGIYIRNILWKMLRY